MNAYLTIDDVTTKNNPAIVDFLNSRKIPATMFVWGERLESFYKEGVYALKHGIVLQNHSYIHPKFSEINFEEAVYQIEKTEKLLEKIYSEAEVKRPCKMFRFPYGDTGGKNQEQLEKYLAENNFITFKNSLQEKKNLHNILWDFDFKEYKIRKGSTYTFKDVLLDTENFLSSIKENPPEHVPVILIHDHTETEELVPSYFEKLISILQANNIQFI